MNKEQFGAMSLPYGLKGYVDGKDTISGQNIYILFNCPYKAATVEVISTIAGESNFFTDKSKFKPILHPLSDLTKPITHNGETFVPWVRLFGGSESYISNSNINMFIRTISLEHALKLIEWHFDIAGLIEKGDAIDVNTLEINTYK